jgi:hypothetical protein
MRYAIRDPQGAIVSLHREPVPGAEPLPLQHPEVQAFLGSDGARSFAQMDADLVRVLEDLIDALIRRNVLRITDLPTEAQAKLFDRKHFREGMQGHALSLYGGGHAGLSASGQVMPPDAGDAAGTGWADLMP